jgi:hypothetical protein
MTATVAALSLSRLVGEAEAIANDVPSKFGDLDVNQLNWRTDNTQWSIAQCLEHLIVSNEGFYPTFDAIKLGKKKTTLWERVPLVPALFGKLLLGGVSPDSKRKLKAPEAFRPNEGIIQPQIIQRFVQQQRETVARFQQMEKVAAEKIIVTSPISKLITYSLIDACRIIVLHEQRHLAQAERITKAPGFPS